MLRNADFDRFETEWGIHFDGAMDYLPPEFKTNLNLAMDAQPALVTTPNAGIPAFLTTLIDPKIFKILLAPNKAAQILGEVQKGSWLDETAMFPVVERTGEVSTYGDRNNNGRAGINIGFPQRQSYLYQVILDWGQRELERAGLARIGYASSIRESGVSALNKFGNFAYFFGIAGLQNYGLTNDPNLPAYLTPGPKVNGGTAWIVNGAINATPNEIYLDFQTMYLALVLANQGLVDESSKMVLAGPPQTLGALTATNSFNVNVKTLLKENFPNLRIESAPQYGSNSNTALSGQGIAGGNVIQLIVEDLEGQEAGYCAFNEKLRSFPVKVELSSFKQKLMQGTWGAVLRMPILFQQMQGV
jgi:hypothetical protein